MTLKKNCSLQIDKSQLYNYIIFKRNMRYPFHLVVFIAVASSQHTGDDSDYDNYVDHYQEHDRKISDMTKPDDFYVISEDSSFLHDKSSTPPLIKSLENPKKVPVEKNYRYTKHRISGYDYDELDFNIDLDAHRCDYKSSWTHCLCQFTCDTPNTVDCYTPCDNGCECKEDYVYDDISQTCVKPEYCMKKMTQYVQ